MAGSCPRLTFKRETLKVDGRVFAVRIEAREYGKRGAGILGQITFKVPSSDPVVSSLAVDEDHRRCGIATKLYEQAAQYACKKFKRPLRSDVERSAASEGFWQKQVRKGRARCLEAMDVDRSSEDAEIATWGRGGCYRYGLLSCPAPASLSGARRRAR